MLFITIQVRDSMGRYRRHKVRLMFLKTLYTSPVSKHRPFRRKERAKIIFVAHTRVSFEKH